MHARYEGRNGKVAGDPFRNRCPTSPRSRFGETAARRRSCATESPCRLVGLLPCPCSPSGPAPTFARHRDHHRRKRQRLEARPHGQTEKPRTESVRPGKPRRRRRSARSWRRGHSVHSAPRKRRAQRSSRANGRWTGSAASLVRHFGPGIRAGSFERPTATRRSSRSPSSTRSRPSTAPTHPTHRVPS